MIQHIPYNKDKAVSRAFLVERTGLSDRKVRQHIEDLRIDGYPIINLGSGYFIASKQSDLDEFKRIQTARVKSIVKSTMCMKLHR
jgi:biotin operon repressor